MTRGRWRDPCRFERARRLAKPVKLLGPGQLTYAERQAAELRRFLADPQGYRDPQERKADKAAQQARAARVRWARQRKAPGGEE